MRTASQRARQPLGSSAHCCQLPMAPPLTSCRLSPRLLVPHYLEWFPDTMQCRAEEAGDILNINAMESLSKDGSATIALDVQLFLPRN